MTGSGAAPSRPGHAPRVAVCIATCSRPAGLRRLLEGIERLAFTKTPRPTVRVIVVENGPPSGARELCADLAPTRWSVEYEHEPRLGIAPARNRAVRRARTWADFLAFIDDDEVPEPTWLDELLHVQRTFAADAVVGPLVRSFEEPAPAWVVEGRFFEQKRRPTGTPRHRASTNNTLVRAALFDALGGFDERFALTGGEDTHFFLRASLHGHRTLWADDAIVREFVPASRATMGWLLRRSFRYGNTWSLCECELWPGPRRRVRRLRREARNIARGLVTLPIALAGGKVPTVRCLRGLAEAAGNLAGLMGVRYEEYRPSRWMRASPNRTGAAHA